ncbi:MAG: ATP-binding cassette domain-containing protein [Candidatus Omnitrophica bacterium]|nr:ATP-binding cassette domain-containing protein [Candidatus Omnitrophota bacterium]
MIEVKNLSKAFGVQKVLDKISFSVNRGEIFVILGESGVGKSVLLKQLNGLIDPDEGSISIDGVEITSLSEPELLGLRKKIGYLFQEGALYDFMNVYENLSFPLREHTPLKRKEIVDKVKKVLSLVGLEGVESKFPSELSGGMKKRVGLARAIILDSQILFCDEPTSGLDPIRSRDISNLIQNASRKLSCTTVITSHDITNALRIADRIMIIKEGKIAGLGKPSEIKSSPNAFIREFIS